MKKIITSSLCALALSLNFSFAKDGIFENVMEVNSSVVTEFKNLFFSGEKRGDNREVKLKEENKSQDKKDDTVSSIAEDIFADKGTSSEMKTKTLNKAEERASLKKDLKEKNLREKDLVCENKIKLQNKKDKISKQIQNQIKDKNKLADSLLEVSNSLATETKDVVDEKIIKLETEVTLAIRIQKNILNIIASSTDTSCDLKNKKINEITFNKIKNLEAENEKQLEKINKFIKGDIKDLLVEINTTENN